MNSIFKYDDYKEFVNIWLESQTNRGHGLLSKIAKHLSIHTTLLSHTLRGSKNLTCEQAILLGEFIGLSDLESDYFILLVQRERAGNFKLKQKYNNDLKKLKQTSQEVSKRVTVHASLTEEQKAQFYSSWLYSAIRQLTSIPKYQNASAVSDAFAFKKEELSRILNFLISTGLCIEKNGKIMIGPANTHIESQSPYVFMHHKNWRIKALEKHNNLSAEELMYTAPFTISNRDFEVLREESVRLIQKLIKTANKTKEERLACLNLDLFFVK